jgi:two-component system, cell cycle response regulator
VSPSGPARESWASPSPSNLTALSGVMEATMRHEEFGAPTVPTLPARANRVSIHPPRPAIRSSLDSELDPITEQSSRPTDVGPISIEIEQRDRALLLRMDGIHAGQVLSLMKDEVMIGRNPDNDFIIDDAGVSRRHAKITRIGHEYVLTEVNARNGTLVQGQKVVRTPLHDGDFVQLGPRAAFRFSMVDLKQEKLLEKLFESSTRDALTGAYNRKHFDERLLSEIAYALRHESKMSLILFDIDHFKKVNDTKGHPAGDAVLRHVAGIALSRLRTEDMFARVGGEEFAILLRGVDVQGAARLAERLRSNVSASPTQFEGALIPVTMSAGCAALGCADPATAEVLLRVADERLYAAKSAGRNRVIAH